MEQPSACPHAAHSAELARLQAESEGRRVELLRLADAHRAEWARAERAEADNAALRRTTAAYLARMAEKLHNEADMMAYRRMASVLEASNPGAPLLRLVEAVRAWKVALDATDGIAAAEQAVLAALEDL